METGLLELIVIRLESLAPQLSRGIHNYKMLFSAEDVQIKGNSSFE